MKTRRISGYEPKVVPPTPPKANENNSKGTVQRVRRAFKQTVGNAINSRSLMAGARIDWDPRRIVKGKFQSYQAIGGEPLELKLDSGDTISAMHFDVDKFAECFQELGATKKIMQVTRRPPKVERKSTTVRLTYIDPADGLGKTAECEFFEGNNGVSKEEKSYLHERAKEANREIVLHSYLRCFTKGLKLPKFSDRCEIIIPKEFFNLLNVKSELEITGSKVITRDEDFQEEVSEPLIVYEIDQEKVHSLKEYLDEKLKVVSPIKPNDLEYYRENRFKFNSAIPWIIVESRGKSYFVNRNSAAKELLEEADKDRLERYEIAIKEAEKKKNGIVLISQMQMGTFFSDQEQIFTLLLEGFSVLAYDNAGKGLSKGRNDDQSIIKAIEKCYQYIVRDLGFGDSKILAKGECAGGFATAALGASHPKIHVWIDQSPNNVGDIVKGNPRGKFIPKGIFSKLTIADKLIKNKGQQLYTIAVPKLEGTKTIGGDKLIPSKHVKQIRQVIEQNSGQIIEFPGGIHVTAWVKRSDCYKEVLQFLRNSIGSTTVTSLSPGRVAIEPASC